MGSKDFGTIIEIGDILVSEDVVTEFFACDYPVCKGACCIIGDSGAPLKEEELEQIESNYSAFEPMMTDAGRETVRRTGFFEIDRDGDLVTPVVPGLPGREECAYCHFEGASCLCAMEIQHRKGLSRFKKPISCSLYPIRVADLGGGRIGLNLHKWDICRDAFAKGAKEKVRVYEFLREPLIEAFGEEFYSALSTAAMMLIASE